MSHCVLCENGCEFCKPDIPGWYAKAIPPGRRTHEQLKAVRAGLHPSGNAEGQSVMKRCGSCRFRYKIPNSQMYKRCSRAAQVETSLVTIYMHACDQYQYGEEQIGQMPIWESER